MMVITLPKGMSTIVDDEDYTLLSRHKWRVGRRKTDLYPYVYGNIRQDDDSILVVAMHRLIMSAATGLVVDHINGNTLDNQKNNLRTCTHKNNIRNQRKQNQRSSQYKGVCFQKRRGKPWRAGIQVDKKKISLGSHDTEESAARAYNEAAKLYFGDFARLNQLG